MSSAFVDFLTRSSYRVRRISASWIHLSLLHHRWITFGKLPPSPPCTLYTWQARGACCTLGKAWPPTGTERSKAPQETDTDQQRPCLIRSYPRCLEKLSRCLKKRRNQTESKGLRVVWEGRMCLDLKACPAEVSLSKTQVPSHFQWCGCVGDHHIISASQKEFILGASHLKITRALIRTITPPRLNRASQNESCSYNIQAPRPKIQL